MTAPSSKPFAASRLKLRRARTHIDELGRFFADYKARKPLVAVVEHSTKDPDWIAANFQFVEIVPEESAGIIGDAVHNLRSSLDLMATELVTLNKGNPKSVYFPFAEKGSELEAAIKSKNLHRAAPKVVDLVRSLKPYKGGNKALRGVHDLDIMDKHKALIPSAVDIKYRDMGMRKNFALVPRDRSFGGITGSPAQMAQLGFYPGMVVPLDFELLFEMRNDMPFQGEPVVPLLERLTQDFAGVVDAFETLCFGTVTNSF